MTWRVLPNFAALAGGIVAGTIANSAIVAALAALAFASIWASVDRRSGSAP